MRATMNTTKSITKNKQCQLLLRIKRNRIGTNDVEHTVRRLNISERAKQNLRNKLMNAKVSHSFRLKKHQASVKSQVWRECRKLIHGHLLQGYMDIWRRHIDEFSRAIDRRHQRKLKHLINKWKPGPQLPDSIRGISVKYAEENFPDEFSSQHRLY